jgi:hypothetical protein
MERCSSSSRSQHKSYLGQDNEVVSVTHHIPYVYHFIEYSTVEPLIILRLRAMGNCLNKDDEFLQYYNIKTNAKDLLVYGSQLQDKYD